MKRLIGLATLVAATTLAHAQGNNAIPGAPASAAKKDLVQRMLVIQQPALENMTRDLIERPARQMMGAAEEALDRVAPEKRQDAVKKIQDLLNKYRDDTAPLIKERAGKIGQTTLGPAFEEKYTEDELKQLVTMLESPVYKKFQQSLPELTNAYAQGVVKELQPVVEPKLKALEQGIGAALGVNAQAPASAPKATPKATAPAASKPAAKK